MLEKMKKMCLLKFHSNYSLPKKIFVLKANRRNVRLRLQVEDNVPDILVYSGTDIDTDVSPELEDSDVDSEL